MSVVPGKPNSRSNSANRQVHFTDGNEQPKPKNAGRGRNAQPRDTANTARAVPYYSWFSGITQHAKGKPFEFQAGQGVPIAEGVPPEDYKGYWYRNNRRGYQAAGGERKQLPPRWYFYYLGTGPHANARYGQNIDGVFWVAAPGVDTTRKASVVDRDPNTQDALVCQFPSGTVLPQGCYVEGSRGSQPASRNASRAPSRNASRSRGNSRAASRASSPNSGGANPGDIASQVLALMKQQGLVPNQPQKVTKVSAKEAKAKIMAKSRQKRNPNKQCNVLQCFGKRSASQNFGNAEMVKLGTSAPEFPVLAELAPTPAAFFFGSKLNFVKHNSLMGSEDEPTKDVYELQYSGSIKFDSTMPGFDTVLKVLRDNINAYTHENMESPKPQRKQRSEVKAKESVAPPKSRVTENVSRELTDEDLSLLSQMENDTVM
uniref:Nucleoprotein n=1 Tax=Pika coronavirus TaxID=3027598 RepID=A0AAT9T7A7_9NIDO|nr:MAG: N [Pika coronavirus] [Pika coronavirus]